PRRPAGGFVARARRAAGRVLAIAREPLAVLRFQPRLLRAQLGRKRVMAAQQRALVGDIELALPAQVGEQVDQVHAAGGDRCRLRCRRRFRGRGPDVQWRGEADVGGVRRGTAWLRAWCGTSVHRALRQVARRPADRAGRQPPAYMSMALRKPLLKAPLSADTKAALPLPPGVPCGEPTSPADSWQRLVLSV